MKIFCKKARAKGTIMSSDEHSYFVTAKERYDIERLHLCSWFFSDNSEFLECGMEVCCHQTSGDVQLKIWVPWIREGDDLQDLYISLKEAANTKFIFNENVKSTSYFKDGDKVGVSYAFVNGNTLTVLPCRLSAGNGFINIVVSLPVETESTKIGGRFYIRFLIKATDRLFSFRQQGISKSIYSYDLKVNEPRNCPADLKPSVDLMCNIQNAFCLHIVPSVFSLAFLSQTCFKNVRILEKGAYEKYVQPMNGVPKIVDNDLMVVFNKASGKESYSFFSVFERESIGNSQVVMAVSLNILVSSFFFLLPIIARVRSLAQVPWKIWTYIPIGLVALSLSIWYILREQVSKWVFAVFALTLSVLFVSALIIVSR